MFFVISQPTRRPLNSSGLLPRSTCRPNPGLTLVSKPSHLISNTTTHLGVVKLASPASLSKWAHLILLALPRKIQTLVHCWLTTLVDTGEERRRGGFCGGDAETLAVSSNTPYFDIPGKYVLGARLGKLVWYSPYSRNSGESPSVLTTLRPQPQGGYVKMRGGFSRFSRVWVYFAISGAVVT